MRLPQSPSGSAERFVAAIYWSTPLFVALDVFYGVSLRIPFLDAAPGLKAGYYVLDLACAVAIALRPRWTALIGYAESLVNITLLILTTWTAYIGMLESAASPTVLITNPFTPERVTSLVLSATVAGASYLARTASLAGGRDARSW